MLFDEVVASSHFTERYEGDIELLGLVIHDDYDYPMLLRDGEILAGRTLYQQQTGWGIVHLGIPVNRSTILHEIAHLLAPEGNHGKRWRGLFDELKNLYGEPS